MAMVRTLQDKTTAVVNVKEEDLKKNYNGPLVIVTLLFFMWGFITCMNDILIPKLQEVFTLQHWQAMLIQTAFFGAYFFVSLFYFIVSATKGDPIQKIGYKNGIIVGLMVAALGCTLFFPAAEYESYGFFLLALFVLASGITILQIAANPYVAILGSPDTA
ncbi:MAG: MFS transporter, partial [Fulvivirga sp.]